MKIPTQNIPSLLGRNRSSGFAQRTIENLDFLKRSAGQCDVHLITQVINSLLGLLVFPIAKPGAEQAFFNEFQYQKLSSSDPEIVGDSLRENLPIPSLTVTKFEGCRDMRRFFERLRNAVAHNGVEFAENPDSRSLAEVVVILRDRPRMPKHAPYDWEIRVTAQDLEMLSRYVAEKIIERNL
jgi:hypothetical protein